jgi:hypothetical protein
MFLVVKFPNAPMNLGLFPEAINWDFKSLLKLINCPKFIFGGKDYLKGMMLFGNPGL